MKNETLYYISPFDFFYAEHPEDLADKFARLAIGGSYTSESEYDTLINCVTKICLAFEQLQKEFEDNHITVQELILGVLKRDFRDESQRN